MEIKSNSLAQLRNAIKKILSEGFELGKGYTHFALFKDGNKIATGGDYSSLYDKYSKSFDTDSIKYYFKIDLKDLFPESKSSDFKIVSRKYLEKNGIEPSDSNNWYKN